MAGVAPNTIVRVEPDKSVNTATLQVIRTRSKKPAFSSSRQMTEGLARGSKAKGKA